MRKKENNHGFKQIIFLKQHEVVEYLNSTRTVTSIWCITNALSRYMQCWQGKILESKHDITQFSTINNDIKQRSTNNKESIRYFKKIQGMTTSYMEILALCAWDILVTDGFPS